MKKSGTGGARDEQTVEELAQDDNRRFLTAALLLFVAKGDGNISDVESRRMIDLISSRLKISNAEALACLTEVLNALQDDSDIARTLRALALRLPRAHKREILCMMLDVAAVDEVYHEGEKEAINMASRILDMPDEAIRAACRDFYAEY